MLTISKSSPSDGFGIPKPKFIAIPVRIDMHGTDSKHIHRFISDKENENIQIIFENHSMIKSQLFGNLGIPFNIGIINSVICEYCKQFYSINAELILRLYSTGYFIYTKYGKKLGKLIYINSRFEFIDISSK